MTNQTNRIHLRYAQYPLTKTKILQCIYKKKMKQSSTLFLKYVLHLWYSLMTISILLFQHFPSVACRRKREMGNKPIKYIRNTQHKERK